jgi:hypothetical protein
LTLPIKLAKLKDSMAKNSSQIRINLSSKQRESTTSALLTWAVNVGRIIIVGTELIALAALFYRFTVDRKIIDLNDKIRIEERFVKSQTKKEEQYRSLHARLENIKQTEDETQSKITIMNSILQTLASGSFTTTNFVINQNTIALSGGAFSVFPVNSLIDTLKQNPNVSSLSLDELTSSDNGVQFKLTIELKQLIKKS